MKTENSNKSKLHYKQEEVVNKIIALLEQGNLEWMKSWKCGMPKNYVSKKDYRGFNSLYLNLTMQDKGYKLPYFLSFLQVKQLGGQVKAGEKSVPVFFYSILENKREVVNKDGVKEEKIFRHAILRVYSIFNVEQTTLQIPAEEVKEFKPIEVAESQIANYLKQIKVVFGGGRAFYSPSEDYVGMPMKESFDGAEMFYSVLNHELSHSTGHSKRLKRETINELNIFGDDEYSKEEVVAELSSCFLCANAGIENKTIKNSSAYLAHWIENLKQDKGFLFKVIGQAQKSADYILKFGVQAEVGQ